MSIPIVLDKSTFQGLNYEDIVELHKYYIVNITPLLVSEILGDLAKDEKEGRKTPKNQVTDLAKKNVSLQCVCKHELQSIGRKVLYGRVYRSR